VNEKQDGPIEVAVCVRGSEPVSGAVLRTLPSTEAAVVEVPPDQCHFPAILGAYDAASEWISANRYKQAASPREYWLCEGDEMKMRIVWPCERCSAVV
jgi:hypothetical protein